MNDFFKNFKTTKPAFQSLIEGDHLVRISRIEMTNSFKNFDGTDKDKLPDWKNATPQLAITIVAAEDGKSGGLTHRFNGCGYTKYDELSEKEIKSGKFEEVGSYACMVDADGDLVRIESEERTVSCENILNQFAASLQIKEGSDLIAAVEAAIADKTKFRATITKELYDGKDQYRLAKTKSVAAITADTQFED